VTAFFAFILLLLHGLWWLAVFLIGALIVVGIPLAIIVAVIAYIRG
jgi:hypothetical protein